MEKRDLCIAAAIALSPEACATIDAASTKQQQGPARMSAESMLGANNRMAGCASSTSYNEAKADAERIARLSLGESLGLVETTNLPDGSVQMGTTQRLRFGTIDGHAFKDGNHEVCSSALTPNQFPQVQLPLTPVEIASSGLRAALSKVIIRVGGEDQPASFMGLQPDGSLVVCVKDPPSKVTLQRTSAEQKARRDVSIITEGVEIATNESVKVLLDGLAEQERISRESVAARYSGYGMGGVIAVAEGADGVFGCGRLAPPSNEEHSFDRERRERDGASKK